MTSFDDAVARRSPAAPGATIARPGRPAHILGGLPPAGRTILQVPPSTRASRSSPRILSRPHRDDLVLWVWPNDAEWENADGYAKLLDMGVDGLSAADPVTALGGAGRR